MKVKAVKQASSQKVLIKQQTNSTSKSQIKSKVSQNKDQLQDVQKKVHTIKNPESGSILDLLQQKILMEQKKKPLKQTQKKVVQKIELSDNDSESDLQVNVQKVYIPQHCQTTKSKHQKLYSSPKRQQASQFDEQIQMKSPDLNIFHGNLINDQIPPFSIKNRYNELTAQENQYDAQMYEKLVEKIEDVQEPDESELEEVFEQLHKMSRIVKKMTRSAQKDRQLKPLIVQMQGDIAVAEQYIIKRSKSGKKEFPRKSTPCIDSQKKPKEPQNQQKVDNAQGQEVNLQDAIKKALLELLTDQQSSQLIKSKLASMIQSQNQDNIQHNESLSLSVPQNQVHESLSEGPSPQESTVKIQNEKSQTCFDPCKQSDVIKNAPTEQVEQDQVQISQAILVKQDSTNFEISQNTINLPKESQQNEDYQTQIVFTPKSVSQKSSDQFQNAIKQKKPITKNNSSQQIVEQQVIKPQKQNKPELSTNSSPIRTVISIPDTLNSIDEHDVPYNTEFKKVQIARTEQNLEFNSLQQLTDSKYSPNRPFKIQDSKVEKSLSTSFKSDDILVHKSDDQLHDFINTKQDDFVTVQPRKIEVRPVPSNEQLPNFNDDASSGFETDNFEFKNVTIQKDNNQQKQDTAQTIDDDSFDFGPNTTLEPLKPIIPKVQQGVSNFSDSNEKQPNKIESSQSKVDTNSVFDSKPEIEIDMKGSVSELTIVKQNYEFNDNFDDLDNFETEEPKKEDKKEEQLDNFDNFDDLDNFETEEPKKEDKKEEQLDNFDNFDDLDNFETEEPKKEDKKEEQIDNFDNFDDLDNFETEEPKKEDKKEEQLDNFDNFDDLDNFETEEPKKEDKKEEQIDNFDNFDDLDNFETEEPKKEDKKEEQLDNFDNFDDLDNFETEEPKKEDKKEEQLDNFDNFDDLDNFETEEPKKEDKKEEQLDNFDNFDDLDNFETEEPKKEDKKEEQIDNFDNFDDLDNFETEEPKKEDKKEEQLDNFDNFDDLDNFETEEPKKEDKKEEQLDNFDNFDDLDNFETEEPKKEDKKEEQLDNFDNFDDLDNFETEEPKKEDKKEEQIDNFDNFDDLDNFETEEPKKEDKKEEQIDNFDNFDDLDNFETEEPKKEDKKEEQIDNFDNFDDLDNFETEEPKKEDKKEEQIDNFDNFDDLDNFETEEPKKEDKKEEQLDNFDNFDDLDNFETEEPKKEDKKEEQLDNFDNFDDLDNFETEEPKKEDKKEEQLDNFDNFDDLDNFETEEPKKEDKKEEQLDNFDNFDDLDNFETEEPKKEDKKEEQLDNFDNFDDLDNFETEEPKKEDKKEEQLDNFDNFDDLDNFETEEPKKEDKKEEQLDNFDNFDDLDNFETEEPKKEDKKEEQLDNFDNFDDLDNFETEEPKKEQPQELENFGFDENSESNSHSQTPTQQSTQSQLQTEREQLQTLQLAYQQTPGRAFYVPKSLQISRNFYKIIDFLEKSTDSDYQLTDLVNFEVDFTLEIIQKHSKFYCGGSKRNLHSYNEIRDDVEMADFYKTKFVPAIDKDQILKEIQHAENVRQWQFSAMKSAIEGIEKLSDQELSRDQVLGEIASEVVDDLIKEVVREVMM